MPLDLHDWSSGDKITAARLQELRNAIAGVLTGGRGVDVKLSGNKITIETTADPAQPFGAPEHRLRVPINNTSGFVIPPRSFGLIDDLDDNGNYNIVRPDLDGISPQLLVITGDDSIPVAGISRAWPAELAKQHVAYSSGTVPSQGDFFGCVEDQWYGATGRYGFSVIGAVASRTVEGEGYIVAAPSGFMLPGDSDFWTRPYSSLPGGLLWWDGSAISRTDYARLFAQIGTTWGNGDGSTTFDLPEITNGTDAEATTFQGRILVGAKNGGADLALGDEVGLVEHDHGASGSHTHNVTGVTDSEGGTGTEVASGSGANVVEANFTHLHDIASIVSGPATVSVDADDNLSPALAVGFVIKA